MVTFWKLKNNSKRLNVTCPCSVAIEIISRYPMGDQTEFSLPASVPLFCLPFGVSVEPWNRRTPFPLPTFSTFALTNALGNCVGCTCTLCMYINCVCTCTVYVDNFKVTLISRWHVFAKLNASKSLPEYTCIPYTWIIREIKVAWTFINRNIILVK